MELINHYSKIPESCQAISGGYNPYWRAFKGDHAGDPNGLMMIVNSNPQPGIFYEQSIPNLCTGVTYEFSARVASIIISK